jgi:hypothetical protein
MMTKRRKGSPSGLIYRVVRTATHIQTGEKSVNRFGAYLTHKEAQARLEEDQEASPGPNPQYEYAYEIEHVFPEDFSK